MNPQERHRLIRLMKNAADYPGFSAMLPIFTMTKELIKDDIKSTSRIEDLEIKVKELRSYDPASVIARNLSRPSVYLGASVTVSKDGDRWCCLLGENLQVGIAGFGPTPLAAMKAFDRAMVTE